MLQLLYLTIEEENKKPDIFKKVIESIKSVNCLDKNKKNYGKKTKP